MSSDTALPGYHIPHNRKRDTFYAKLEDERERQLGKA